VPIVNFEGISNDAQLEQESFAELYSSVIPEWLLERLTDCGWSHPTRIQKAALDAILIDQDDAVVQGMLRKPIVVSCRVVSFVACTDSRYCLSVAYSHTLRSCSIV
jgi:hypothetical protein